MDADILIEKVSYKKCGLIGQGAVGAVYLVSNNKDELFAMKVVNNYHNPIVKESIDKEIKIQRSFKDNKHVIQCFGFEKQSKKAFIVLELGEFSLRNEIEMKELCQRDLLVLLEDVCRGLESIHKQKIIHRDIKPENIIVKNGVYKITDFGVSSDKEVDDSMTGTVLYWPPEILFEKQQQYTRKVDVWSLGVSVFECYFKINPFCFRKGLSFKEALEQLKKNIGLLTPEFNMKKLLKLLKKEGFNDEAAYITKKLQNTDKTIIQNLCLFLEADPNRRESIDFFLTIFHSFKQACKEPQIRTTQINRKFEWDSIIPEILLFCKTKNLFYQTEVYKRSKDHDKVVYALEIGIDYLQEHLCGGSCIVLLEKSNHIRKDLRSKNKKWQYVRQLLSEYYFFLKYDRESQSFKALQELKLRILVCSVFLKILQNQKQFCDLVNSQTQLKINSYLQVFDLLSHYSDKNVSDIEHAFILKYYV